MKYKVRKYSSAWQRGNTTVRNVLFMTRYQNENMKYEIESNTYLAKKKYQSEKNYNKI